MMRIHRGWAAILMGGWLAAGCATHHKHQEEAPPPPPPPKPVIPVPIAFAPVPPHKWSRAWSPLFDGVSLTNWAVTDFAGHGDVKVEDGRLKIFMGAELTGITWTNGPLPRTDYEISLDTERIDGGDFFCALTFPVSNSSCSLILGGWGGGIVGLSSIDGQDASENDTSRSMGFESNHWYHLTLRVTPTRIAAWLDDKNIIDENIAGHKVSLRPGDIYLNEPLGVATYTTTGALKNFKLRLLEP